MSTRIPPQNLEAEQSILGGLMLDREALDQIGDVKARWRWSVGLSI
jgi:replicative DNA helicase